MELTHDNCVEVLGARVNAVSLEEAVRLIEERIAAGGSHYVCFSNVHTVTLGRRDGEFRRISNEADLALPDGMPLVWAARLRGGRAPERVDGPSLMLALCRRSAQKGHAHFFYGGGPGVAALLARRLRAQCPGLGVAGCHSPPFGPLGPAEDQRVVDLI
ncbi:MAG: WecB/TagA/CpsF family glycosyltransferase, partial [Planctomycetota bacterium]